MLRSNKFSPFFHQGIYISVHEKKGNFLIPPLKTLGDR